MDNSYKYGAMQDLEKVWRSVQEGMKVSVSEAIYKSHIKQTSLLALTEEGDRLIAEVGITSPYSKTMLEQRYYGQLTQELKRLTNKTCELRFVLTMVTNKEVVESELPLFTAQIPDDNQTRKAHLKPEYTFANYAVSGSNQMAYAAAIAVSKKPGVAYNPLFIYGGVGVGKTHLMQGIGHVIAKNNEVVLFCTGEEFTNDLVEGIRNKNTDKVRAKYRKVKLLMIDDVQFIAGKASVQEEFFHTFNSIQREGGQVVMTSDRPPAEIAKLEERLRSRFGAGMIVDVGPADFELRTAILLIKAQQRNFQLSMESAQLIATQIEGVRELEGFLVKLVTETELTGISSQEAAEKILKVPMSSTPRKVITPNEVITFVGNYYGVGVQQLKGERRTKTLAWPRQILMYILRNDLRLSFEEVGRLIGGRDHTTVMHADGRVKQRLLEDLQLQHQLHEIQQKLLISG